MKHPLYIKPQTTKWGNNWPNSFKHTLPGSADVQPRGRPGRNNKIYKHIINLTQYHGKWCNITKTLSFKYEIWRYNNGKSHTIIENNDQLCASSELTSRQNSLWTIFVAMMWHQNHSACQEFRQKRRHELSSLAVGTAARHGIRIPVKYLRTQILWDNTEKNITIWTNWPATHLGSGLASANW